MHMFDFFVCQFTMSLYKKRIVALKSIQKSFNEIFFIGDKIYCLELECRFVKLGEGKKVKILSVLDA